MRVQFPAVLALVVSCSLVASCGSDLSADPIAQIMNKPRYTSAKSQWSMVVMDASTGQVLHSLQPDTLFLTGSVRKLYSVGTALNGIGADYRFETPVYRNGTVDSSGKLTGDLILKASGVRRPRSADGRSRTGPSISRTSITTRRAALTARS
jgi:D-alanyl-D-alanine carboxypeptidase